jgi:uncharacterized membrane protein
LLLVGSIAMAAFWTLRLYSDWRGMPHPHLVEGLLVSIALPVYLLAIAFGIAAIRRQIASRSFMAIAFIVGGLMFAAGLLLTVFAFSH